MFRIIAASLTIIFSTQSFAQSFFTRKTASSTSSRQIQSVTPNAQNQLSQLEGMQIPQLSGAQLPQGSGVQIPGLQGQNINLNDFISNFQQQSAQAQTDLQNQQAQFNALMQSYTTQLNCFNTKVQQASTLLQSLESCISQAGQSNSLDQYQGCMQYLQAGSDLVAGLQACAGN